MNKGRINTSDLSALLASHLSVGIREAEDFIKALIEVMEEQLLANDVLKIKELGTFKLQWNAPRKSVDVNTGEEITIDGYYKISFTPDPDLKESVNAPYAHLKPVVVGGAELEEMDEEDEEEVEEEIMKEMEDPQRLAEAMRSITEQAIEIKDILSEMNMISDRRERTKRPVMVDEDEDDAAKQTLQRSASRSRSTAQPIPDDKTGAADHEPSAVEPRTHRPGPSVPYGPPPETPKVSAFSNEQELPSGRRASSVTEQSQVKQHGDMPRKHSETAPPPSQGTVEMWPPVAPVRTATTPREDEQASSPGRSSQPLQRRRVSSTYFAEDDPQPTRSRTTSHQNKNGGWMLFLGLIMGGVVTYFLTTQGVLPEFAWPFETADDKMVSDYVEPMDVYSTESFQEDMFYDDSPEAMAVVDEQEPVDSLQLLFDTPRVYTQFIATETVIEGSRMTRISERHYGEREFWVYIYEANRDLLDHPDDIAKGMVLKIPYVDSRLLNRNNPRVLEYVLKLHDKYIKK
jgi:nucleoid DNA-binding protein